MTGMKKNKHNRAIRAATHKEETDMYYTFNAPRFNEPALNNIFRSLFDLSAAPMDARPDVKETPDAYLIRAVLPGIDPENINVSVKGDELTIKVERPQPKEDNDGKNCGCHGDRPFHGPCHFARFERTYSLEGVDKDGITADCKNGIVYVTLPKQKKQEEEVRRIPLGGAVQNEVPVLTE